MSPIRWLVAIAVVLMANGGLATAQGRGLDDRWFGSWQLDTSRSHFADSTLSIKRVRNGYEFNFGATKYVIGDDGRDYTTVAPRTTSLKPIGENRWIRYHKTGSKIVDRSIITLEPSGNTMRIETTAYDNDGKTHQGQDTEERISGGPGLAGLWHNTNSGINVTRVIVMQDAGDGRVKVAFPRDAQFYIAETGGSPVHLKGEGSVDGVTVSVRRLCSTKIVWTDYINGRAYTEGIDTLEEGGRTLREVTWPVEHPSEKQDAVYSRLQEAQNR